MPLGVASHQQYQFNLRHSCQQSFVPQGGALGARRQVPGFTPTGIAKTHGYDADAGLVVKSLPLDLQPLPQAITAGVVPRDACSVHFGAGSLADYQQFCTGACPQYGIRTQGQGWLALATVSSFRQQIGQGDIAPFYFIAVRPPHNCLQNGLYTFKLLPVTGWC
jgi:hypothetical protein